MRTTIEDLWQIFAARILPPDVQQFQYDEMHRAFFAGAIVTFDKVIEVASKPHQAHRKLAAIDSELRAFAAKTVEELS